MAKKATSKGARKPAAKPAKAASKSKAAKPKGAKKTKTAKPATVRARPMTARSGDAGDAFIKLLQSPLVADLVAVAATSALAALAEHGFSGGGGKKSARAGNAVKEAGKAAAAAVGRRLGTEIDEIKAAAKSAKAAAKK